MSHQRLRRWTADWAQCPPPKQEPPSLTWGEGEPPHPTRSTFLKWGERESEAEVTIRQGEALLHRRGSSWRRKFGDLAGDHAGKTKGLQVGERNSEGVLWGGRRLGGPLALLCPPNQRHRPSVHTCMPVSQCVCTHVWPRVRAGQAACLCGPSGGGQ